MTTTTPKPFPFDPSDPRCPGCATALIPDSKISATHYDEHHATLHVHICPTCHHPVGYVVLDEPAPKESYMLQEIER